MTGSDPVTKNSGDAVRILHVTFNMGIGGTEQVIRQLVSNLPDHQFSNTILCIDGQVGEIGLQVRGLGINVISIKRSPGLDFNLVRMIRKIIRDSETDLVHCHQYTPWVYGWMASVGTRAKVVFTEHGRFHPDRYRYKAALINPLMALRTGGLIAISEATREALARYEFIPARKIRVIYNGINGLSRDAGAVAAVRKQLGIPDGARLMGTVARLDPVKNQSMMLDAFARVARQHSNVWLLMVGDGPDRHSLEQQAIALGVEGKVIFTGFRPEPADYLAAMDVFLLSSHTEGTSMTLLEAMSLGIPAIATAVGGNREIVRDGETGILVPAGSTEAFADSMNHLLEDDTLREMLGAASHRRFDERFSVAPMVAGYQALYQQLLQG